MGRKKKESSKILTETELKIMNVIWSMSEGSVHQILEALGEDYAYNTVSTIVRVLEQKGFVSSRKDGRTHIYASTIPKEEYEDVGLENMVDGLFGGTPLALMKRMIDSGKLSANDLAELKKLIEEN